MVLRTRRARTRPGGPRLPRSRSQRDQVGALLPKGGRVFFTSGATEALNWALLRGAEAMPGGVAGLSIEHAASLQCLERLNATILPVDGEGLALPPDDALIPKAASSAIMLVNNEVGTIQPVADFAAAGACEEQLAALRRSAGLRSRRDSRRADLIAISAHKIHGPKGIGALWVKDGVDLPPLMFGGAQEQGMRSGTVSPALCAGFGAAAALAAERFDADAAHVERLWSLALDLLPEWTINGAANPRYHGNLNVRREGVNGLRLMSDARETAPFARQRAAAGRARSAMFCARWASARPMPAPRSASAGAAIHSEQQLRDGRAPRSRMPRDCRVSN